MFTTQQGTAAVRNLEYRLADELATEIAADAKTVAQIAHDCGITTSDLLQWLGGTTEPYTKHQARATLEFAATVARGLTDPSLVSVPLFDFSVTAPAGMLGGTVGVAYTDTLLFNNNAGRVTWAITAGKLPGGLSIASAASPVNQANITGTPTAPTGTYNFTATGTDQAGLQRSIATSIVVA
jgi:hypothetical protein